MKQKIELNGYIFEPKEGTTSKDIEIYFDRTLGKEWIIEKISRQLPLYILKNTSKTPTIKDVWEILYKIDSNQFQSIEPDFNSEISELRGEFISCPDGHLSATKDYDWAIKQINAEAAWQLSLGEGIIIGHTDTGYTRHKEIWKDPLSRVYGLQPQKGWDYQDGDNDASAVDTGDMLNFYSHGTSTASLIISEHNDEGYIKGIAPRSSLIPIRVDKSVIVSLEKLIRGIDYAIYKGVHITSTSMGNPFGDGTAVDRILKEAVDNGIVPIAAAGQLPPFELDMEITPAKSPYAVSCTASTQERKPWKKAFKARSITVAAPGESVWNAESVKAITYGTTIKRGCGTSYSTALTAGSAALWYSYLKPSHLYSKVGKNNIFYTYLKTLSDFGIDKWNYEKAGPGILNVEKHLKQSKNLPSLKDVEFFKESHNSKTPYSQLQKTINVLNEINEENVPEVLCLLFSTPNSNLEHILNEIGTELRFHIRSNPQLKQELTLLSHQFNKDKTNLLKENFREKIQKTIEQNSSNKLNKYLNN